jgi:hypothetical protein
MFTIRAVLNHHAFCSDIARLLLHQYLARVDVWMCIVALKGMRVPPKHIIAQMNATQLAWLEPHIEGFPKQAFKAAVKRNDIAAAKFIWQRRKLHPHWGYRAVAGEIPTMEMYEWIRSVSMHLDNPHLYWCDRLDPALQCSMGERAIALIAARADLLSLPLDPETSRRAKIHACEFELSDVANGDHFYDAAADRAVELNIAHMENVRRLSTWAAIKLADKYPHGNAVASDRWMLMLRWDDHAAAWLDTLPPITFINDNVMYDNAKRWMAKQSCSLGNDLSIRYGTNTLSDTKYMRVSGNTLCWLVGTREGAVRLREVIDDLPKVIWTDQHVRAACRYVDPVTWRKMYPHGVKRKHLAAALQYGNIPMLAWMYATMPGLFSDHAWLLGHMRHARTWRWLVNKDITHGHIHLDLDSKPCLIVAFHRARQQYTYAHKSAWIERLRATLPPV